MLHLVLLVSSSCDCVTHGDCVTVLLVSSHVTVVSSSCDCDCVTPGVTPLTGPLGGCHPPVTVLHLVPLVTSSCGVTWSPWCHPHVTVSPGCHPPVTVLHLVPLVSSSLCYTWPLVSSSCDCVTPGPLGVILL